METLGQAQERKWLVRRKYLKRVRKRQLGCMAMMRRHCTGNPLSFPMLGVRSLFFLLPQSTARIGDDLNHLGLLVDRVGFVPGAKVKDFACADLPYHAAAEPFAGGPAFLEDYLVGFGHVRGRARCTFRLPSPERFSAGPWQSGGRGP